MKYEVVIGLEVHVQLNTASKMFCGCSAKFGSPANAQTCPVCLGLPGALPVINKKAITLALKTALALNCKIAKATKFDRKHYFYPDLPKNFQISQYDQPLSHDGFLEINIDDCVKKINLKRIHLEEDAGKLIHRDDSSLVDYNRSGTPLMEIVTQPDLGSPQEAHEFLVKLKGILEYLEVSDCNMEEGSLRCDANISIRPQGQGSLGTKTEIKNMNSFKGVKQALEYEAKRQADLLDQSKAIEQETRLWDSEHQSTVSMRTKEEAHDYRYFPEPDLMPFSPEGRLLDELNNSLPEMPDARNKRFTDVYGLSSYDAAVLTKEKALADFFEETVKIFDNPKVVTNWIMGDLLGDLSAANLSLDGISFKPSDMADILRMIESGTISSKMGKELLKESIRAARTPAQIAKEKGLSQITDEKAIAAAIELVVSENAKTVADFRSGKEAALAFLVGQVMKATKGKANPKLVNELLRKRLS